MTQPFTLTNLQTGEGLADNPLSLRPQTLYTELTEAELGRLHGWSIASRIVDIIPETVASLRWEFPDGKTERLFGVYLEHMLHTWKLARLYGSAELSLEGESTVRRYGYRAQEAFAAFYGRRSMRSRGIRDRYCSVLEPVYETLLYYLFALSSGSKLSQKYAILRYPVPNLLENMGDCKIQESLQEIAGRMQTLGVIPYDASAAPPGFDRIDLDKFDQWIIRLEQTLASTAGIPYALLFQRSPSGATSGRFEVGSFVLTIRQELRQFQAAWARMADTLGCCGEITTDTNVITDLYIQQTVNTEVAGGGG
jgi:hypothetical protein